MKYFVVCYLYLLSVFEKKMTSGQKLNWITSYVPHLCRSNMLNVCSFYQFDLHMKHTQLTTKPQHNTAADNVFYIILFVIRCLLIRLKISYMDNGGNRTGLH